MLENMTRLHGNNHYMIGKKVSTWNKLMHMQNNNTRVSDMLMNGRKGTYEMYWAEPNKVKKRILGASCAVYPALFA